jgi:hypothetical protein
MTKTLVVALVGMLTLILAFLGYTSWRRRSARRLYRRTLEQALADGRLTPEESAELERIRQETDLTPAEVRLVARAIYRGAIKSALADERLSPEEDRALADLQQQLGISESDMGQDVANLARLRLLARVEAGELPSVEPPIQLVPHESCHWVVQASLADRLELPGRGRPSLAGIDLPVTGRKAFTAAGKREALKPREDILPVDLGMFIVTSRRAIFQGAKRNVSVPHARLENIVLYADGIRIDEIGNEPRGWILVDDADLTAAILLSAARRRREEIRPTRRGQTA